MEKFTIENIIGHCNAICEKEGLWGMVNEANYKFHDAVREYLMELHRYKDLEEQGRLIEQKHGTWESLDSYVYECDGMWQCSECGEDFYFEFGTPLDCRAYYCPNCGAKMELKELEVNNHEVG